MDVFFSRQDVIALRKGSGEISGEILLNGFPQEKVSFRRCSGYVEQFDVQSAELTVRETIRFSALLRLEKSNPVYQTPDGLTEHIEFIIKTLELTNEADILVGSEEEGGLTFEQKKRLSIAVELAASPSIVFLDEVSATIINLIFSCDGLHSEKYGTGLTFLFHFLPANIGLGCSGSTPCDERSQKNMQRRPHRRRHHSPAFFGCV